jgi:glycosyltransferase involved in cell wall biosynthesis
MHIIIVCPSLAIGGAEKLSVNIANYYASIGHTVELLVFSEEGHFLPEINLAVRIKSLEVKRARFAVLKLSRYIKQQNPDIVISMLRESNIALGLASYFGIGKAKIILREASGAHHFGKFAWLHHIIELFPIRLAYKGVNGVIFNSDYSKLSLANAGFLPKSLKTIVIHNPVLRSDYKELLERPVTHPWLIQDNLKVIISSGRLAPQKEFDVLICAFKLVHAQITETRLIIFGEGPDREKLNTLINDNGLANVIDLPGFVPNPLAYMNKGAMFVSSSVWEPFGNVIVEAMAAGLVVVATDSGGPKEILMDGLYGVMIPVGDIGLMAEAITGVLQNKYVFTGIRGRASEFTVPTIAQKYLDFIQKV